jgi:hypothetical protein
LQISLCHVVHDGRHGLLLGVLRQPNFGGDLRRTAIWRPNFALEFSLPTRSTHLIFLAAIELNNRRSIASGSDSESGKSPTTRMPNLDVTMLKFDISAISAIAGRRH